MQTVAVIDYGMGNLHSVAKALEHVGAAGAVEVTTDAEGDSRSRSGGVSRGRRDSRLHAQVRRLRRARRGDRGQAREPFLGICVGMQALLDSSEENDTSTASACSRAR